MDFLKTRKVSLGNPLALIREPPESRIKSNPSSSPSESPKFALFNFSKKVFLSTGSLYSQTTKF
ncbi:MAG: hypothetical protein ACD_25C00263G0003 [uncultured bacterium]|nr:MAG: hypothetical protein ACD_25C00263G0003 [uncultured bacterium]